jgi:hypothetical protein
LRKSRGEAVTAAVAEFGQEDLQSIAVEEI